MRGYWLDSLVSLSHSVLELGLLQKRCILLFCVQFLVFVNVYRHDLENLVVTGRIAGRGARVRQRLKYLDSFNSLSASWKDNVSPTQLIRASEDRVL